MRALSAALRLVLALQLLATPALAQSPVGSLPQLQGQPAPGDLFVLDHVASPPGQRTSTVTAQNLAAYVFSAWGLSPPYLTLQGAIQAEAARAQAAESGFGAANAANVAAIGAETSRAKAAEGTNAAGIAANSSAISAEAARAKNAEAFLAPISSPALAGTPTAPTAAPMANSAQLATTAYADAAVAVAQATANAALPHVATLAALRAYAGPATVLLQDGFYAPGDLNGAVARVYSSASCTTMDQGSCVTAANGGSWLLDAPAGGVSLRVWGAKCDSIGITGFGTDDTFAEQNALKWADLTGRHLLVPGVASTACRSTAPLTSSYHVNLSGDGAQPYGGSGRPLSNALGTSRGPGSWLFFDHGGQGLVSGCQVPNAPQTGTIWRDFGTLRAQPAPPAGSDGSGGGATWTAGNFDFDLVSCADETRTDNVMMENPTKGLLITGGRASVDSLRGQPLVVGIQAPYSADTVRVTRTHFFPFWANNSAVTRFALANLQSLLLSRVDDAVISDFYTYSPFNCVHFYKSNASDPNAVPKGVSMRDIACDGVGQYGVWLDGVPGSTVNIAGLGMGSSASAPGATKGVFIDANSTGSIVALTRPTSTGMSGPSFDVQSGRLSVLSPFVPTWNASVPGAASTPAAPIFNAGTAGAITIDGDFVWGGPGNGGGLLGGTLANILVPTHVNAGTGALASQGGPAALALSNPSISGGAINGATIGAGTPAGITGTILKGGGSAANAQSNPGIYTGLAGTGQWSVGWNASGGGGETGLFVNRGGGSIGGFSISDVSNAGALTRMLNVNATDGLAVPKVAAAPTRAPGAGYVSIFAVAGTTAGTCKLQALAGTSTTPSTILDNIGSGC